MIKWFQGLVLKSSVKKVDMLNSEFTTKESGEYDTVYFDVHCIALHNWDIEEEKKKVKERFELEKCLKKEI